MSEQPVSRPGRKRSEESKSAILAATIELVAEVGYAGLTIEGIAKRSGTGKQTIYRWWPSKADVLLDAAATKADLYVPIPDEGDFAADLRAFLTATFALGSKPQIIAALRALMAEAQVNAEFGERFRTSFLQRRRDALGTILDRAAERGDLPPDISRETITDIVFGTLWYRILAVPNPLDATLTEELITTLTRR
jgi:AcrR family transcriptional regulator